MARHLDGFLWQCRDNKKAVKRETNAKIQMPGTKEINRK